jgi:hypothetical protein
MALLTRLTDPTETWGATGTVATTYAPLGYRLWLAPADAGASGASTVAWPLAGDPASFGSPAAVDFGVTGLRSGIVTGADATTLGTALAKAQAGATVTSGGKSWQAWIRPLFPDELGS